jgi:hypothetical protein
MYPKKIAAHSGIDEYYKDMELLTINTRTTDDPEP